MATHAGMTTDEFASIVMNWLASAHHPRFNKPYPGLAADAAMDDDVGRCSPGLIVHHTDGEREYAYDRKSRFGRLDEALDAAAPNHWSVVDMKRDWKAIFSQDH